MCLCMYDGTILCSSCVVEEVKTGSFDSGDPLSTNLYVGNISPKVLYSDSIVPSLVYSVLDIICR